MENEVAIKVEHVSKKYCKSIKRSMTYGIMDIGRNMFGLTSLPERLRKSEFWALDDISFEVKKGETLWLQPATLIACRPDIRAAYREKRESPLPHNHGLTQPVLRQEPCREHPDARLQATLPQAGMWQE